MHVILWYPWFGVEVRKETEMSLFRVLAFTIYGDSILGLEVNTRLWLSLPRSMVSGLSLWSLSVAASVVRREGLFGSSLGKRA